MALIQYKFYEEREVCGIEDIYACKERRSEERHIHTLTNMSLK